MKRFLPFLLAVCMYFPIRGQVIIEYSFLEEHTAQELQDILADFGVPPGLITIEHDVEAYRLTYNTPNATGTGMTVASGAVVFPKGVVCDLPLASYQHGTTSVRTEVPSYSSAELMLGLLWAGRGYATALPDYLGLGDSPGLHPYVHADSEASATIDMLRAAKELAPQLGYSLNDDLFLFGYSQGGHATMAAFKEIQENHAEEFTVTGCVPMSGPYDVSGVQTDFINSGQPYATPGYLPYVLFAYQSVYGNLYNDVSEAIISPYDTILPPLFDGTYGMGYINSVCTPVPTDMSHPDFQDDFNTNPDHPFRVALRDNDLIDWAPMSPLRILYCSEDEQVYYQNSEVAFDSYMANGAPDVSKTNFGPYDHGGCFQFCMLSGLGTMDSLRTLPLQDAIDGTVVMDESAPGAMDGSITVGAGDGTLTYEWANGTTGSTLSNIGAGNYAVTITNGVGCQRVHTFNFEQLLPVRDLSAGRLDILPNPARDYVSLITDGTGKFQAEIRDVGGRLVWSDAEYDAANPVINISELNPGVYFVELKGESRRYIGKLMKPE